MELRNRLFYDCNCLSSKTHFIQMLTQVCDIQLVVYKYGMKKGCGSCIGTSDCLAPICQLFCASLTAHGEEGNHSDDK